MTLSLPLGQVEYKKSSGLFMPGVQCIWKNKDREIPNIFSVLLGVLHKADNLV